MIAGTVLTAVGTEIMIVHPFGEPRASWSAVIVGGTALFLSGRILIGRLVFAQFTWRAFTGLMVLLASSPGLARLPPLAVGLVTNVVLLGVVLAYTSTPERREQRRQQRRAEERRVLEEQMEEREVAQRRADEQRVLEERRALEERERRRTD